LSIKDEIIPQKTPYRKRQIISICLLLFAGISLILLELNLIFNDNLSVKKILINGFEGGFVGGLCDWFAVWKTYNAIEKDSLTVADEIGEWVASDLLNHETLKQQINQILDSSETSEEIYKLLDTYFDTQESAKEILRTLWSKMDKQVIEYIVHYEFSLNEMSLINNATQDTIIIDTVKNCLGGTLIKVSEEQEFKDFVKKLLDNQNMMTKILTSMINIPDMVRGFGEKLKSGKISEQVFNENEKFLNEFLDIITMSADKYILSWQELTVEKKEEAVNALVMQLREASLEIFSKFIIQHKNTIRASKTLRNYAPVREFFEFIQIRIDSKVSNLIGQKISERLKSQDPKDFRINLEWKTRNILENIRINGTLLGFAIGFLIGGLKVFFG
jgi:uncharacterized membrane-anchored protein YjiN (DUF445 family)